MFFLSYYNRGSCNLPLLKPAIYAYGCCNGTYTLISIRSRISPVPCCSSSEWLAKGSETPLWRWINSLDSCVLRFPISCMLQNRKKEKAKRRTRFWLLYRPLHGTDYTLYASPLTRSDILLSLSSYIRVATAGPSRLYRETSQRIDRFFITAAATKTITVSFRRNLLSFIAVLGSQSLGDASHRCHFVLVEQSRGIHWLGDGTAQTW